MYGLYLRVMFQTQKVVARIAYTITRLRHRKGTIEWVVGPYETATMVHSIARALENSYSVMLAPHPFYTLDYDWAPRAGGNRATRFLGAWFHGPLRFGVLAAQSRGFIYVGGGGFLNHDVDHRGFEFAFLRARGRKVVCYFVGSDIRSPQRMRELSEQTGLPNLGTYLPEVHPTFASPGYETTKREIARVADTFADAIFTVEVNQLGYLESDTHPFLYFYPDEKINGSFDRYEHLETPVIVHAPSSPILKGTQLVRAAIAQLREEGRQFEYVELVRVPHEEVRRQLERAHIVLNQFYAEVPGVFGIEAMAAGAVLVTSADERLEPQLPAGSNTAWVVTHHHQVYTHLRRLLDAPETWEHQARAGNEWVRQNATRSVSGAELNRVLNSVLNERADGSASAVK